MAYEFRKATRTNVKTITGFASGTGGGKTWTMLAYCKGLAGGKRFGVIDTENGRASMYSDFFDFDVLDLCAPFTPDNYFKAIKAAEKAGYPVIGVDQFSHEWEGEGGILDEQVRIVDEMVERSRKAGDTRKDWELVEVHNMRAWAEAKKPHKKMVTHLTQMNCHLVLNFRAEDKIEIAKEMNENGKLKTVIRPKQTLTGTQGWVPICERRLPFELTASFLFIADRPGFPIPIKLQEQHKKFFPEGKQVGEESGRLMAEWARGGSGDSASGAGVTLIKGEQSAPTVSTVPPPVPPGEEPACKGCSSDQEEILMQFVPSGKTDRGTEFAAFWRCPKGNKDHRPIKHADYLAKLAEIHKATDNL